ncbi:hypothetical protein SH661x_000087 [Planctomicrobium sp. SH661]|uniref:hypothetical protein n=1 Tax=Planctomicrobium sp. SH661 TaxID=3448124 RepID=UPI003F5AFD17
MFRFERNVTLFSGTVVLGLMLSLGLMSLNSEVRAESPEEAVLPIDLTSYYQTSAAKFDSMQSYPWRDVPRGHQVLGNIPLEIGGMICLWGGANAKTGLVFPEQLEGIRVGRNFSTLYLYHATFHRSEEAAPVVRLVLRYADGTSHERVLEYGTHVRDWYRYDDDPEDLGDPKSQQVWTGINSMWKAEPPRQLHFFITEIEIPHPDQEVASIDLYSAKGNSASCILAMTTGPEGMLKVDPLTLHSNPLYRKSE